MGGKRHLKLQGEGKAEFTWWESFETGRNGNDGDFLFIFF